MPNFEQRCCLVEINQDIFVRWPSFIGNCQYLYIFPKGGTLVLEGRTENPLENVV